MRIDGIIIDGNRQHSVLAYIYQYPYVMAHGRDVAEAKAKLQQAWQNYLSVQSAAVIQFTDSSLAHKIPNS